MHITALVERSAQIIWGARQLGEVHHLPAKVDAQFRQRLRVPADPGLSGGGRRHPGPPGRAGPDPAWPPPPHDPLDAVGGARRGGPDLGPAAPHRRGLLTCTGRGWATT